MQTDSLSTKVKKLRLKNPGNAYLSMRAIKPKIIDAWEEWARKEISAAADKDSIIVRDKLSAWLDALEKALDPQDEAQDVTDGNRISEIHGLHRAVTSGYSLPDMLREYSLLRKTLLIMLDEQCRLDPSEKEIINDSIDKAMAIGAEEYARFEKSQYKIALEEAERSNKDLEQFAAIAAHDLKAPLATMSGYLEILREDVQIKYADSQALLETIVQQSKRLLTLVDRVLEYSRLRAKSPEFELVDLTDVANVAMENLKTFIEQKKATVTHGELPLIKGDPSLLVQLFQNLIANGVKFNDRITPEVSINCRKFNNYHVIDFADNGIGFDMKDRDAIFTPYKRLHKSEYQGSGLGLATVTRVLNVHQAHIKVQSQPGRGSIFTVEFPIHNGFDEHS